MAENEKDYSSLRGYRGNHRTPTKGTPLRAAFDAAHARWCGPDCAPTCQEWQPDVNELAAAILAYEAANNAQTEADR